MQLRPSLLIFSLILSLSVACGGDDTPVADPDTGDRTDVGPDAEDPDADAGDTDTDEPDAEPDVEPREGPVIVVPEEITLNAAAGQSVEATFDVENPGTQTLIVNILSPNNALRVSPDSLEVDAGESAEVGVRASCPDTGGGNFASDLTFNTNDPENLTFPLTVRLVCGDALPGSLNVSVEGLEEGLVPVLTLRSESGTETPVVGGELLEDLQPGDYTLVADPVTEGLRTFEAEDVPVSIASETQTDVTLTFELVTASWELIVDGLPSGVDANITVDGPEDIGPLTGSETFSDLTPGTYELTPEPVTDGPALYRGEPIEVELASGDDVTSELLYDLMLASFELVVEGLPAGADADITLEGPEGFETTLTGDEQLDDLVPGDYTLTPADVSVGGVTYSATGTSVELISEQNTAAVITYVAPATTLNLAYNLGDQGSYTLEIVDAADAVVATRTLSGQGSEAIEVPAGTYSVRAASAPTDQWGNDFYITGAQDVVIPESNIVSASVEAVEPTLVTRTDDAGLGSLREVIGRVNADSVVTFAPGIDQVDVTSGQIGLARNISIIGNGRDITSIEGGALRIFSVTNPDAVVLIQSLSIRGARAGSDQGGAIYNQGDLTLFDVHVDDNHARNGGAVYNTPDALLTVEETLFTNNQATQRGGAIHNAGTLNIDQARFSANGAGEHGGAIFAPYNGGIPLIPLAQTNVERALFELNSAPDGGAISVSSVLRVQNTTFDANQAEGDGGAILVGATGDATLNFATFAGNDAIRGAAVLLDGSLTSSLKTSRSVFAGNTSQGTEGAQLERVSTSSAIVSGGDNFISAADLSDIDEDATDTIGLTASPLASPLGTLADNGGFTRTIEVVEASQADLSITEARCLDLDDAPLTVDQRGVARPFEGLCTIGAWQLAPPSGPYTETFDTLELSGSSYVSGSFVGVGGITWEYTGARNESGYEIDGKGLMFKPSGSFVRATIAGGVDAISVDYRKGFTGGGNRQIEILVNGNVVATSPAFDVDDEVFTLSVDNLGITGEVVLEIRNALSKQIVIDNITWE